MKIRIKKEWAFLQFPEIPTWFLFMCAAVFCIGAATIAWAIFRALYWAVNHIRFV